MMIGSYHIKAQWRIAIPLMVLIGAATQATAQSTPGKETMSASIHDGHLMITFDGQIAKDIFDSMPKNSIVLPTKKCGLPPLSQGVTKVKGGFICTFHPGLDLLNAYNCTLDASTKTGKALKTKPHDICDPEDP